MPILRSRRYKNQSSELFLSLVAFRLRQEWFALSVNTVYRVIPLDSVYGDPQGTGISLTRYQNQEILVIDVGQQIFAQSGSTEMQKSLEQRYLVLIQMPNDELVGLPIDSPPSIRHIPQSALTTIPNSYIMSGNIRCLSSQMAQISGQPALFLLDTEQLVHTNR